MHFNFKWLDIHGYRNLLGATKHYHRLLWVVCILAGLGMATWWTAESLIRFLEDPISINMINHNQPYMELPESMFCPVKSFNYSKLRAAGKPEKLVAYIDAYFQLFRTNMHNQTHVMEILRNKDQAAAFDSFTGGDMTDFDSKFLENYGLDCGQFFTACRIGLTAFDCCQYATPVVDAFYGNCFILKGLGAIARQAFAGTASGLAVELDLGLQSAGSWPTTDGASGQFRDSGAFLSIRSNFSLMCTEHFPIQVNRTTFATVTAQLNSRSTKRKGGCRDTSKSVDNTSLATTTELCETFCFMESYENYCNCTQIGGKLAYSGDLFNEMCTPQKYVFCFSQYDETVKAVHKCIEHKCQTPPCSEWDYSVRMMYGHNSVAPSVTTGTNFGLVFVAFDKVGYTELVEYDVISFDSLLSAAGGHYALFLGASLISIIQLAAVMLDRFLSGGAKGLGCCSLPCKKVVPVKMVDEKTQVSEDDIATAVPEKALTPMPWLLYADVYF